MRSSAAPVMNPSSPDVSRRMSQVRSSGTDAELQIRREIFRRGLRYRVDRRACRDVNSRADLVFGPVKVAVYIDGCFWHSCPKHSTIPKANRDWWVRKLDRNKERDQQTDRALSRHGWKVIRIWEHEDPIAAANRIEKVVKERRAHAQ